MHEVNESTYKRNLYRLEEQMKGRAEKIRQLEKELENEREEKARLVESTGELLNSLEAWMNSEDLFDSALWSDVGVSFDAALAALQPKPEAV